MNSKDIFVIVLLIVILAILYKVMQSLKLQGELTQGIAIKNGVVIPKQKKKLSFAELLQPRNVEDAECEDCQQEEEEEQEEQEEQEYEEESEEENQEEEQTESEEGGKAEEKSNVKDLEPRNHMIKVVKPKREVETQIPKKKNSNKPKLKGYEMIAELLSTPLNAGDLKDKWKQEYGETPDVKIIYNLNYALSLDVVKKHPIGKRFLYAKADMFEGDVLKNEFLPQQNSQEQE